MNDVHRPAENRVEGNATGAPAPTSGTGRESVPSLVKQLTDDFTILVRKEISLAKAELREAASQTTAGITSVAGGAGLLYAGVLFVLLAVFFGLAQVMTSWLAALIVGVVVMVIGFVMVKAGKKKVELRAFVPERTVDSLQKDKEATKRAVS